MGVHQTIEIKDGVPLEESSHGGNNPCGGGGGGACWFSDHGTRAEDEKERHASMTKLQIAVVLCLLFLCVEVVGGIKANSLAILTDAAHLLSDVAAFAISLFSLWAAGWQATPRQSYGFFRMEVLGALLSVQLIWLLTGILIYEAADRLAHGSGQVHGLLMFAVSAIGFVVNVAMAVILGHDHSHCDSSHEHSRDEHEMVLASGHSHNKYEQLQKHSTEAESCRKKRKKMNINVQGAYLHVLGDSIQSLGVMLGGAVIWYRPEWKVIDLICTIVFSVIVLGTTMSMLRRILEVLMESTPREIDAENLEKGICEMDGVVAVHELHVWAITVGKLLLSCHVSIDKDADADLVLAKVVSYIKKDYNISQVTIQIERAKMSCYR